jgi:hypothetical protein
MFLHPSLSGEIAQQRRQELLASADRQRLVRQVRAHQREARQASQAGQPLRRALGALRPAPRM